MNRLKGFFELLYSIAQYIFMPLQILYWVSITDELNPCAVFGNR